MSVPQNTSERNKLPARFPGHIVRINNEVHYRQLMEVRFEEKRRQKMKSSLLRLG